MRDKRKANLFPRLFTSDILIASCILYIMLYYGKKGMKKLFNNIVIVSLLVILIFNIFEDRIIHNSYFSTVTNIGFLIIILIFIGVYIKSINMKK